MRRCSLGVPRSWPANSRSPGHGGRQCRALPRPPRRPGSGCRAMRDPAVAAGSGPGNAASVPGHQGVAATEARVRGIGVGQRVWSRVVVASVPWRRPLLRSDSEWGSLFGVQGALALRLCSARSQAMHGAPTPALPRPPSRPSTGDAAQTGESVLGPEHVPPLVAGSRPVPEERRAAYRVLAGIPAEASPLLRSAAPARMPPTGGRPQRDTRNPM